MPGERLNISAIRKALKLDYEIKKAELVQEAERLLADMPNEPLDTHPEIMRQAGTIYSVLASVAAEKNDLTHMPDWLKHAGDLFFRSGDYRPLTCCARDIIDKGRSSTVGTLIRELAGRFETDNPCLAASIYNTYAKRDGNPKQARDDLRNAIYFYAKSWCLRSAFGCIMLLEDHLLNRQPSATDFLYQRIFKYHEQQVSRKNFEHLLYPILDDLVGLFESSNAEQKQELIGSIPHFFWVESMHQRFYPTFFELIKRISSPAHLSFFQALVAHWKQSPLLKNPYSKTTTNGEFNRTAISLLVDGLVRRNNHEMTEDFCRQWIQCIQEIAPDVPAEFWLRSEEINRRKVITPLRRLESMPQGVLEPLLGTLREKIPSEEWPNFMRLNQGKNVAPSSFFSQRFGTPITEDGGFYERQARMAPSPTVAQEYYWKAIDFYIKDWNINKLIACLLKGLAQLPGLEIPPGFWEQKVDNSQYPLLLSFILQMSRNLQTLDYLKCFKALLPTLHGTLLLGEEYTYDGAVCTAIGLLVDILYEQWNKMGFDYRKTWIQCIQDITAQNTVAIWNSLFDESFNLLSALYADEAKKPELESLVSTIKEWVPEAVDKFSADTQSGLRSRLVRT